MIILVIIAVVIGAGMIVHLSKTRARVRSLQLKRKGRRVAVSGAQGFKLTPERLSQQLLPRTYQSLIRPSHIHESFRRLQPHRESEGQTSNSPIPIEIGH
jgi:hypothetical protein